MKILVIADHNHHSLSSSTLPVLACAAKLGGEIHVAILGHQCEGAARAATACVGVNKVLCVNASHLAEPLAEEHAQTLMTIAKNYTHIVFSATSSGKNLAPRLAALLDVSPISEITAVVSPDTFVRPIYAGNALATVQSTSAIKVLTVRGTAFDGVSAQGGNATLENINAASPVELSNLVSREVSKSERPELTAAKIVVSGGRGVGSADNFKIITALADKLGAAVGASRAAVDAGYVPNDYQVGQTGKIVAPQLYIAIGISGAIQHLAGMKESKVIVAINKDEDAPIMQVADYAVIGDLFQIVPEMIAAV